MHALYLADLICRQQWSIATCGLARQSNGLVEGTRFG
jgi:hypothetical protein